jgi:hypothetical protein
MSGSDAYTAATILLSCIIICGCIMQNTESMENKNLSWLHTDGNKIKNESNSTIYLRGACLGGLGESGLTGWNPPLSTSFAALQTLAPNANVIRVCTSLCSGALGWGDYADFDSAIDAVVALAQANGKYVFIEFHGDLSEAQYNALIADPADLVAWHHHFIDRYSSNKNVAGCEIFNEPNPAFVTQAQWRTIATAVYNDVHATNSHALVLVPSSPFYRVHQDWIDNPLGDQAVYAWDTYFNDLDYDWYRKPYVDGDPATGLTRLKAFFENECRFDTLMAAGMPVFGTEYGFMDNESSAAMNDWYSILNEHETHYYTFWWWGNLENYGLNDNWTSLGVQGTIWNSYLWSSGSTPAPIPVLSNHYRRMIG